MINEEAKEIIAPSETEVTPVEVTEQTAEAVVEETVVAEAVAETPEAIVEENVVAEAVVETPEAIVEENVVAEAVVETPEAIVEETVVAEAVVETPETIVEETVVAEAVTEVPVSQEVAEIATMVIPEETEEIIETEHADYSSFQKKDYVSLLEKLLVDVRENPSVGAFRKSEDTLKQVRPLFEQIKAAEKGEALANFKATNEDSEEGFEFKYDSEIETFDKLFKSLKDERAKYFSGMEKERDKNFNKKTELLDRLRAIVEGEENADPSAIKTDFAEFKKIQEEWKSAGNINSPHNNTLWQTFHALVDRFYSNRSIYFELLELDRKRNLQHKIELCTKIEKISEAAQTEVVTGKMLDEAVAAFEEYKHVGPAPKEENELIWQRVKDALDVIYGKRREQMESQKNEAEQIFALKLAIEELVAPFATFNSGSISEWNERTKALLALQDQWNNVKGFMPREKGKELSDKFWVSIKTFFKNKGDFFKALEGKRDENLQAKKALIEEVEAIVASGEDSAEITQNIIRIQKTFRDIGHVPEKDKDAIYDRFKKACDGFFDAKRSKNQGVEKEFEANLIKKNALCDEIEAQAKEGANTAQLSEFKAQWSAIGFVPKKDMQTIQKRYIAAVNQYVSGMGLTGKEREKLTISTEPRGDRGDRNDRNDRNDRGNDRGNRGNFTPRNNDGQRRDRDQNSGGGSGDVRRKIQTLENDIVIYRNNLEFFARSKNADKLRADVEAKIEKAAQEIQTLKQQL